MKTVAIGALGGSGTRAVAEIVRRLGYYIGDDLNDANDNLWFTLLFKRVSILAETDIEFTRLAEGFVQRMQQGVGRPLSCFFRPGATQFEHDCEWLAARLHSFENQPSNRILGQPWGWKEPNTHLVIERWLQRLDDLVYVHIRRHPLDMAFNRNMNQLRNWGPVLLDRPVTEGPRDALSYWCAAERRIDLLKQSHPQRLCIIEYDRMCQEPQECVLALAAILHVTELSDSVSEIARAVLAPVIQPRSKAVDLSIFRAADIQFIRNLGY